MKQLKVAFTDETKAYLDDQARAHGRNFSEEVRARVEQSQVDDIFDAVTKELGRDVMQIARMSGQSAARFTPAGGKSRILPEASWHDDQEHFEAFKVAVEAWLNDLRNRLELKPAPPNYEQRAAASGKATANAYAHLKPMLVKHRPMGRENIMLGDSGDKP